jgi:hypothetical protein
MRFVNDKQVNDRLVIGAVIKEAGKFCGATAKAWMILVVPARWRPKPRKAANGYKPSGAAFGIPQEV